MMRNQYPFLTHFGPLTPWYGEPGFKIWDSLAQNVFFGFLILKKVYQLVTKAPFSIQSRKAPSWWLISKLTQNLVPRSPVPGGKRPEMGGCIKLVSHHKKRVDLNVIFYRVAKEHFLSKWTSDFGPRIPVPGGKRPKLGQKWVGVLRLVSHHTNRVGMNGMLYQGAKDNILSQ